MRRLWAAVAGLVLVVSSVLVAPLASAGAVSSVPLTGDGAFVTAAYNDFLGRNPTDGELAAATSVSLVTPVARAGVVVGLSRSTEWVTVTVDKLYTDTLGRAGDKAGVAYWVGMISSGKLSVAQVAAAFYSSPEYFSGFGKSDVRTWVLDLYTKILQRDGTQDSSGVNYWVATTAISGRGAVAYAFYQSSESRHMRVKGLYETLLGRAPDPAGWDYWAGLITTQGDLALAALLAESPEYYTRAWTRYGTSISPASWQFLASPQGPVAWTPTSGNDSGYFVGQTLDGQGVVCGNPCESPTLVTTPAGYHGVALIGATSTGEIVGYAYDNSTLTRVNLAWSSATATPTFLQSSGYGVVTVTAVSPSGEIVGYGRNISTGENDGLAWSSPSSTPTDYAAAGFTNETVSAVTSSGEIVGSGFDDATNTREGVVWSSGTVLAASGYSDVSVVAVTTSGEIIGSGTDVSTGDSENLVWSSLSATPSVLDVSGYDEVNAVGVTSSGDIVGYGSNQTTGVREGLVWTSSTATPSVLDSEGYTDVTVTAVSSSGEISGYGYNDSTGAYAGLIWSTAKTAPTDLTITGGDYTDVSVSGESSSGEIFGGATNPAGTGAEGLVWSSASATPTALTFGTDGYTSVTVTGVSSSGEIVGEAYRPSVGDSVGLVWSSASAAPTVLAAPTGLSNVQVAGVSSSGEIVGHGQGNSAGDFEGLVWSSASSTPSVLAIPAGYNFFGARAVSSSGEIVGWAESNSGMQSLVWSSFTATPTVLADPPGGYNQVLGVEMGSSGEILGVANSTTTGANEEGLVWPSASAVPTVLASLPGFSVVSPQGMSSSGAIVGLGMNSTTGEISSGGSVGLVWSSMWAVPTVLAAPDGYGVFSAMGVTPSGVVFGAATDATGQDVGFLYTP